MSDRDIVLAFSGGLDTSYCVPWLLERGYTVTTVYVDTGGTSAAECAAIEERALALGAARHRTVDAAEQLWHSFVVPFIKAGAGYQNQYPLLCSDRYVIVEAVTAVARELGTDLIAHGCTAMGNDQLRFDHTIEALGPFTIVAPIRELQAVTRTPRDFEIAALHALGHDVPAKATRYTINENCLGVTVSGGEIDAFGHPGPETFLITSPPTAWPGEPLLMRVTFAGGALTAVNGVAGSGPAMLADLNETLGPYGVGRGIYTGDTAIGLKGRIVYECPGLAALLVAHRALEEAVLSKMQNAFKPVVAREWIRLVYEGGFHEPLRRDLQAFIDHTQHHVSGTVELEIAGGRCHAVAIDSSAILGEADAVYAQSADWTAAEAIGFIKLAGQSTRLAARRNARLAQSETGPATTREHHPCTR